MTKYLLVFLVLLNITFSVAGVTRGDIVNGINRKLTDQVEKLDKILDGF